MAPVTRNWVELNATEKNKACVQLKPYMNHHAIRHVLRTSPHDYKSNGVAIIGERGGVQLRVNHHASLRKDGTVVLPSSFSPWLDLARIAFGDLEDFAFDSL